MSDSCDICDSGVLVIVVTMVIWTSNKEHTKLPPQAKHVSTHWQIWGLLSPWTRSSDRKQNSKPEERPSYPDTPQYSPHNPKCM